MATRSLVLKKGDDGRLSGIYVHWDGYPSYMGKTLQMHYTNKDKLDALIAQGHASIVERNVETSEFYHRDHNGTLLQITPFNKQDIKEVASVSDAEYVYIGEVKDGEVVYTVYDARNRTFSTVDEAIKTEENVIRR
jgi:hypothetical protein